MMNSNLGNVECLIEIEVRVNLAFVSDWIMKRTHHIGRVRARFDAVVPPAYYAHLAAFRARFYMEPELSEKTRKRISTDSKDPCVGELPELKEKVKKVMFYS
ncbi:hypothetical protein Syun_030337 [Stephania yunnanensis]|uniref:Uncharacterized protein n=1 Tax=Stephania yunnanensis TaxID=152371 RepID=A0AAP0HGW8_9MAGN